MSQDSHHHTTIPSFIEATNNAVSALHRTSMLSGASLQFGSDTSHTSTSHGKKRRHSKMKAAKQLARSVSTPQIRDQIMSDSDIDKKRNKLGYQRISIACAHCRRRKIRCLVAEADPHGRCQNCIRLKKECVFYPVDQQGVMENRSQPSNTTGADSGPSSVVSSSPPTSGSERLLEQPHAVSAFHTTPSSVTAPFTGLPLEPGSALPVQGSFIPPEHSYRPPDDHRMPWNAAEQYNSDHLPVMASTPQDLWRYNQMRGSGDFAPFPSGSTRTPHLTQTAQNMSFIEQRDGAQWQQAQQPLRSMSYGNIEGMRGNGAVFGAPYQSEFHAPQAPLRPQQPPSSIDMNAPMMVQGTSPHTAPVGAQSLPPYAHPSSYAFSQDHSSATSTTFPAHPSYPGPWYSDPTSFGPLEEEPDHVNYADRSHQPGQ